MAENLGPGLVDVSELEIDACSEIEEQFYFINSQTQAVMIQSFDKYQFNHWEDDGGANSASPLSRDVTLMAIYNVME